jgi:hypothetical protein
MISTGTLLRIFGAAILLIAVQFASVAARAHAGHMPDGHHHQAQPVQGHHFQGLGTAAAPAPDQVAPTDRAAPAEPVAQAEATARNTPGAPPSAADTCVMGCCGYTGCCGAALAAVWPSLPPKACSLRIGFARLVSVRGVDPQGLRKPPRPLA